MQDTGVLVELILSNSNVLTDPPASLSRIPWGRGLLVENHWSDRCQDILKYDVLVAIWGKTVR